MRQQVSLQRLQQFLLEVETRRGEDYKTCGRGEDGSLSPRVVINDAAFGPVGGDVFASSLVHVVIQRPRFTWSHERFLP